MIMGSSVMAQEKLSWMVRSQEKATGELLQKYGEIQKERIERGLKQVADFWRAEDGGAADFEAFVLRHFAGDQQNLDAMFDRYQWILEKIGGHMNEITLALRWQSDLDIGPILPFDEIFASYSPAAHINDDFFRNKLAFIVLLNFPLTTLDQRLTDGEKWTRRQWAEARLAQNFSQRVPANVNQAISEAAAVADQYIAEYNIWMHHLLDNDDKRLFPEGMRLLSHWNLRDEIKAQYSNGEKGLPRQQMIQKVMEHIVLQTIPDVVVNNPHVDWNPYINEVYKAAVEDSPDKAPSDMQISSMPEPDTRYEVLLGTYKASKLLDSYSPTAPTHIRRSFDVGREIPEDRVREMFEAVLSAPVVFEVAKLIENRLGRKLQPFDIWYNGFKPRGTYSEQQLDEITRKKYPTAQAYENDMARMLVDLGFTKERANYLMDKIQVDPARGSGHAWGTQMHGAKSHLRTRVAKEGMDYKGYNIAVHEMGHNVEQTFSLYDMDYYMLQGVPNTAFTEALAFVFQNRDLELLGLSKPDAKTEALRVLDEFWGMYEISGVALVDMAVWHWMYDHPEATAAELKDATVQITRNIWNKYYAPVFETKDVVLPGVYSHMIHSFLYLPNYPIGHLIAHQIEDQVKKSGDLGAEFERMAKLGNIAPDLWMKQATGAPVGAGALISAAQNAVKKIK